jgi:hypothetical protein
MDKKKPGSCILAIGDCHIPYHHPDAFKFLDCINETYKPSDVVQIGDEIEGHSISMHDSKDPDLLSPGEEFKKAIFHLKDLYLIFPRVTVLESNHGSLVYRRAKFAGLPIRVLKPYSEILDAPKGWKWVSKLTIRMTNGEDVYFEHGRSGRPMALSRSLAVNTVQGHFHSNFSINYWGNNKRYFFCVYTGCLIDDESLAFAYNKATIPRPLLGSVIIQNGIPKLIPMILDKNKKWIGKI